MWCRFGHVNHQNGGGRNPGSPQCGVSDKPPPPEQPEGGVRVQGLSQSSQDHDMKDVVRPRSLHLTPYTLHDTPYTLHTTRYTPNLALCLCLSLSLAVSLSLPLALSLSLSLSERTWRTPSS